MRKKSIEELAGNTILPSEEDFNGRNDLLSSKNNLLSPKAYSSCMHMI